MTKDEILKTAGNVGKLAMRGAVYVGTNVALVGGGLFYSMLLAGRVKNPIVQTIILAAGIGSSSIAGYFVGDMVDNHLKEEYDLDVDGV